MSIKGNSKKKGKIFGELESVIMEKIWNIKDATVRDIVESISKGRGLAYTTVMTVMTRMVEKGYLVRKELKNGSFVYRAKHSRDDFYAKASRALFGEILKSAGSIAVAQFVDVLEEIDPKQIEELKKRINKAV